MSHGTTHSFAIPTWLYHAEHGKKMFDAAAADFDLAKLKAEGWVDNPAKVGEVVDTPDPERKAAVEPEPEPEPEPEGEGEGDEMSVDDMLAVFKAEPEKLDIPELLELGKRLGAKVRKNMKEGTLIQKIKEVLPE